MALNLQVENAIGDFAHKSGFLSHGGVVIDLDGTAVHEFEGRTMIPRPVELGLKALYDRGRPVVLNSLRFPLSVMRTFGKEWIGISNSPIPVVTMNGSQVGYIKRDEKSEQGMFEERGPSRHGWRAPVQGVCRQRRTGIAA